MKESAAGREELKSCGADGSSCGQVSWGPWQSWLFKRFLCAWPGCGKMALSRRPSPGSPPRWGTVRVPFLLTTSTQAYIIHTLAYLYPVRVAPFPRFVCVFLSDCTLASCVVDVQPNPSTRVPLHLSSLQCQGCGLRKRKSMQRQCNLCAGWFCIPCAHNGMPVSSARSRACHVYTCQPASLRSARGSCANVQA